MEKQKNWLQVTNSKIKLKNKKLKNKKLYFELLTPSQKIQKEPRVTNLAVELFLFPFRVTNSKLGNINFTSSY